MIKGVKLQDKGAVAELRQLSSTCDQLILELHKNVASLEIDGAKTKMVRNMESSPAVPRTDKLENSMKVVQKDEHGVLISLGQGVPYAAWWSFGGRNGAGGYRKRVKSGRDMFSAWSSTVRKKSMTAAESILEKWKDGRL